MTEVEEVFYFYTSHDEDGQPEVVIPDELLAGDPLDEEDF